MAAKRKTLFERLVDFSLSLPEAWEDHPWGETVAKVRKKVFVFFGVEQPKTGVFLCVKLPESATHILPEDWAEPAGYGLGKSDWVYIKFDKRPSVTQARLEEWITESYRHVAPKTLAKMLERGSD
ncbi:MAG: MmcQ/YjbR family DNA-binding protein [Planctomycetes bacterium]|nr:MmcQ/YjbR family DNA-binding protein [Planctomycetota bacterium]